MQDTPTADTRRTVLVTGATGFIGSRLALALPGKGYAVRALVRDAGRAPRANGIDLFEGDLLRPESLKKRSSGVLCKLDCCTDPNPGRFPVLSSGI